MTDNPASLDGYHDLGWQKFPRDGALHDWLKIAGPAAMASRADKRFAKWLVCGATWFVGVNALDNDIAGRVGAAGPLRGQVIDFIRRELRSGMGPLDRAQVSICYPGYPQPRDGESAATFAFRRDRDAAHIDGVHPVGPDKRRKLLEFHGFLLGIPVTDCDEHAAPLVVWQGSHRIMAAMFGKALAGIPAHHWHDVDLTEPYQAGRRQVFETCRRLVVHGRPGEAYLLHPMALHGVAPWQEGAIAPTEGRAILYFRPEVARNIWLNGNA